MLARSAIESLRSGVPSRHAVAQLGTTQHEIKDRFDVSLAEVAQGRAAEPLVIAANFGAGKSHLLEYLQSAAEGQGFVTSFVVISPEMPLGNAHVVLKAVAEEARAPGRIGKALPALAGDPSAAPSDLGPLRYWAGDAGIDERFHALLLIYEHFRADEELRAQILGDFEGKLLSKAVIKQKLREIGKAGSYVLAAPRNAMLAHDRLRLLGQFFRTSGSKGLVVFFDELERVAKFSVKQRIAVYQELGWWRAMAEQAGSGILPVFAMTDAFLGGSVTGGTNDQQRFLPSVPGQEQDERDRLALRGIEILKPPFAHFLNSPSPAEEEEIKRRVRSIYERAYGISVAPLSEARSGVRTSIRSEIRRWITQWDLQRYYPDYASRISIEEIEFDTAQIDEQLLTIDDLEEDMP
jgi:hypothetical protein